MSISPQIQLHYIKVRICFFFHSLGFVYLKVKNHICKQLLGTVIIFQIGRQEGYVVIYLLFGSLLWTSYKVILGTECWFAKELFKLRFVSDLQRSSQMLLYCKNWYLGKVFRKYISSTKSSVFFKVTQLNNVAYQVVSS